MEEARTFTGEVEIDELFWPTARAGLVRTRSRRQDAVIGLLKRSGKVFIGVVKNCSRAALEPIIKGQVLSQTIPTAGSAMTACS